MRCDLCEKWTTARVTRYGNGKEIVNWRAPEGKGRCSDLDMDTPAEFGCTLFDQIVDATSGPHIAKSFKNGAPWQHWVAGPCPDCRGLGSGDGGACRRCVGVGRVQYHDDGYISDNHTKKHPKESVHVEPPKCRQCGAGVELRWVACPMCGSRIEEPMAETEHVDSFGNQGGAYASDRAEKAAARGADVDEMNERSEKIANMRRMTVENGCTPDEAKAARAMADMLEAGKISLCPKCEMEPFGIAWCANQPCPMGLHIV